MRVRQEARLASASGYLFKSANGPEPERAYRHRHLPPKAVDQHRTTEREWLWHPKNVGWADAASAASAWGGSGPSTTIPAPRRPDRLNHN